MEGGIFGVLMQKDSEYAMRQKEPVGFRCYFHSQTFSASRGRDWLCNTAGAIHERGSSVRCRILRILVNCCSHFTYVCLCTWAEERLMLSDWVEEEQLCYRYRDPLLWEHLSDKSSVINDGAPVLCRDAANKIKQKDISWAFKLIFSFLFAQACKWCCFGSKCNSKGVKCLKCCVVSDF